MAKAQRYSMEQVEAGRKKLRGLASQKAGKTRAEVAELLAGDIRKAAQQGYGPKEIRDILAEAGLSVPLARIRALLNEEGKKEEGHDESSLGSL